ncbi:MAG: hypothetical protein C0599_06570 [Salinivirgaceae bacterium]|nr:MAG: hypothetical protein C0599_06570 [Salinivirgaceae bacterium]
MYVAKKKRKENIVEFIIYMLQVQDTIRAFGLNKPEIERKLLPSYNVSEKELEELREWYFGLVDQLISENKQKNGIVQSILNTINEVNELHLWLLDSSDHANYSQIFENIRPSLIEYKIKTKVGSENDIQLAINLIYSFVLLKMKGEEISDETSKAVKEISLFLNKLARYFVDYENGNIQVV